MYKRRQTTRHAAPARIIKIELKNQKICKFVQIKCILNAFSIMQKPIPKLQKREKTQDILRFIDAILKKNLFVSKINESQDILCFLTLLKFRKRFLNRIAIPS